MYHCVMECLGNSFSASFVIDIPLAGTEMLSGEGWFSKTDLLHFNCSDLWAGNAVQQTAGEEHFPAVLQVRAEVLRLFRGQ